MMEPPMGDVAKLSLSDGAPLEAAALPRSGARSAVRRFLLWSGFGATVATIAITAIFAPALAGREILAFRDMLHNYAPLKALFWMWPPPLWNDHAFSGSSALADLNQQPFYLPNLAFAALGVPVWPGIAIYLWVHVLFGTWAAWALCRRVAPGGAGAGAVIFALCGFSLANFSNPQWACAAMWAPAVLLAFDLWAEEGGWGRAALVALCLAHVLLAGDPPLFALLAATGSVLACCIRRRSGWRLLGEGALIAFAVAILILPQLAATLRAFPGLRRAAGLPRDVREQWSLHPVRVAELFVPQLFGPLFDFDKFWGEFTVSPPWKRNYLHSIYAGVVGPALVGLAIARRRRTAMPWVAIAIAALLLAFGRYFFHLYGVLGEIVPGFRAFRYPQRMVAFLMPAWAVLVALGTIELGNLTRARRVILAVASALLAIASLAVIALLAPAANATTVARSELHIGLAAAGVAAVMLLPQKAIGPALALVLAADLWTANGELLGTLPRSLFDHEPAACGAIDRASHGALRSSFRVYVEQGGLEATQNTFATRRTHEYEVGRRNVLEQCGFRQAVSLTSLDPLAESELWAKVGAVRMLRTLSTQYAVTAPGEGSALGARELLRDDRWGFSVSELSDVSPVVFRPDRVVHVAAAEVPAAAAADPALLGPHVAALEGMPRDHARDPEARLLELEHAASWRSFTVSQKMPGYWVVASTFDQDWRATIDGVPAPIEHADLVRRAIWVPPGQHRITMQYEPTMLLVLFAVSLLLMALLGVLAVRSARASESVA
jgi:hypothetical protein